MGRSKKQDKISLEKYDNSYQALAFAIITTAANDYRFLLKHNMNRFSSGNFGKASRDEIEEFFRSEYFQSLSNADGKMILQKLKKEFAAA